MYFGINRTESDTSLVNPLSFLDISSNVPLSDSFGVCGIEAIKSIEYEIKIIINYLNHTNRPLLSFVWQTRPQNDPESHLLSLSLSFFL